MKTSLTRLKTLSSLSIFCLVVVLTLLFTWQAYYYSRDWSLRELHLNGEDRILSYISGIRRDLNRYQTMPFVLSQSSDVRQLLGHSDPDLKIKVNRFLEQTNQISGTRNWSVLDAQGEVVASSDWRRARSDLGNFYASKPFFREALTGEYGGYFDPGRDQTPLYFLSAPIYRDTRLIGVAVISVDLRKLQESWTATREHLAISNEGGVIFLSSLESMRYRHLPGQSQPKDKKAELPYRWVSDQLQDNTRIALFKGDNEAGFLVQSVLLDDLRWQIHFLSELTPMRSRLKSVVLFSLGGGLAIALLMLFIRERWLKDLSRQEARELRLKNEAQQRAVINNTQAGLIILDDQGRVRFINPRALSALGLRSEQILMQPIDRLIAPDQAQELLQNLAERLSDRSGFQPINLLEGVAVRADGSHFPMMISINPIAWGDQDGYLVTLVDITKRKRAEQALQQANEVLEQRVQARTRALHDAQAELIQQSKLAALGTMSAAIAHELNQPLTAIRTSIFSTRLLLERGRQDTAQKNLEQVVQMTNRMALITGQLKTFAYKRPERLVAVSVQKALEQILPMFEERIANEQVELQIERDTPLEVLADQPRLEQVLINLVRNALDAMADSEPRQLCIELCQEGPLAVIIVADAGPGLSEEVLEHLFDPFFTTKEVGQGLGLGLSISYGIIRDLDGSIRAVNQPDGGARFQIKLPLYTHHHNRDNDE
ncbi:MAG: ATP-binding protein [Halopseudomonas sp.]